MSLIKDKATPSEVRKALSLAFYGQTIVAIILIAGCFFSLRSLVESQRWVSHSDEVLQRSYEVQEMASHAQRDFRGYWLSGQARLLEASLDYQNRFENQYSTLRQLVSDNPNAINLLEKINSDFIKWKDFFRAHQGDPWSKERHISTVAQFVETSESLLADISHDLAAFLQVERDLRASRFEKSKQLSRLFVLAISASTLLIGLFFFVSWRRSVLKVSSSFGAALEAKRIALEKATRTVHQLDLITNEAPVLLAHFDESERLLFANTSFCNWFGLSRSTMCGKSFEQILGEDKYRANKPYFDRVLAGEKVSYERASDRDGDTITLNITLVPHSDNDGTALGFVVVASDVSRFKQIKENELIYRAIGEAIDYGIWVCTPDGRNTFASDSFLNLVGITQEQCSSFGWGQVLHPDDAEETLAAWKKCVATGTIWDREHRFLGADGKWHPILARGVPIRDENGNITRWAGINLDISNQHKNREALESARSIAEKANRVKDAFLAILSHELRTPLTPILGWAQELQELKNLPTEVQSGLAVIERNAKVQGQLIEDLLDISRIQSGKLGIDLKIIDLVEVTRAVVYSSQTFAKTKSISISAELPESRCLVDADPTRMQQVVWNLLNNAIKFSPAHSEIKLRFAILETSAGKVARIEIQDSGKGISPEFLPRIFDRFSQEDTSEKRGFGGLGLGLSLVKNLLELQRGSVEAQSPGLGKGATFTIKMPLASAKETPSFFGPASELSRNHQARLEGISVLIVDDDVDNLELFNHILNSSGAKIRLARSAAQGRQMFNEQKPDVLVSDISMPGEDGYLLIKSIRALDLVAGRKTPAIALTAFASSEEIQRILSAGFCAHISKPVNREKLVSEIARLAQSQNSQFMFDPADLQT